DIVTNLVWTRSNSTQTGNLVANGGGAPCGDPVEFFGESYAAPEGITEPAQVADGSRGTFKSKSTKAKIKSQFTGCGHTGFDKVATKYTVSPETSASRNEIAITRKLGFKKDTGVISSMVGVRPYVPRLPVSTYNTVLFPNAANTALNTAFASSCGGDCF